MDWALGKLPNTQCCLNLGAGPAEAGHQVGAWLCCGAPSSALGMVAWSALPSPDAALKEAECPQEASYLSPGGASGFPFAAPARMFCNEFRKSIHSGKN